MLFIFIIILKVKFMANRRVNPENKRMPFMLTMQAWIQEKIKTIAAEEDVSASQWVEDACINKLNKI